MGGLDNAVGENKHGPILRGVERSTRCWIIQHHNKSHDYNCNFFVVICCISIQIIHLALLIQWCQLNWTICGHQILLLNCINCCWFVPSMLSVSATLNASPLPKDSIQRLQQCISYTRNGFHCNLDILVWKYRKNCDRWVTRYKHCSLLFQIDRR